MLQDMKIMEVIQLQNYGKMELFKTSLMAQMMHIHNPFLCKVMMSM